jgi:hypothetical protein
MAVPIVPKIVILLDYRTPAEMRDHLTQQQELAA